MPLLDPRTAIARTAAAVAFVFAALAGTASAQISPVGVTNDLASFFVRGTDSAFDPTTNGYLVVGAAGSVVGVCVNADGLPTSGVITIKAPAGTYGAFPRVQWSPNANNGSGAFLVVWPEEQPSKFIELHARTVTCAGAVGVEQVVSGGFSAWLESGADIAYSTTSQRFLVVWKGFPPDTPVKARLLDPNGTPVGSVVQISAGFGRDPSVTWNPTNDEFGVGFSGETGVNGSIGFSGFARVPAANPAGFSRTTFNQVGGALMTITDIDYNPGTNRYVMTWFEVSSGLFAKTAEIDAAGNVLVINLASSAMGSYDALSMAFNPVSGTFLLVGLNRANDFIRAAELNGLGIRTTPEDTVSTNSGFYNRVSSSQTAGRWNATVCALTFTFMRNQIVQTATVGGPTPPPPPPQPVSNPLMVIDTPTSGATVATNEPFAVAGWALDLGSTTGTGVQAVHVWAVPVGGASPQFLGAAAPVSRPDVGAAFGSRFTPSGYGLAASLATPGAYDITVFALSTVTGTFNNAKVARLNVQPPASIPRMFVDAPRNGDTLSQNIVVAGWALDAAFSQGTGVDAVHVWAYPAGGGAPIFVAAATYGGPRPDVAAAFGAARFTNSGFRAEGTLPPGSYTLVVFAHSTVANSFNNAFVLNVTVM